MDCSACQHYQRGRGQPACLKCKKYLELIKLSCKRQSIRYEHIPQAIIEQIADQSQMPTIIDVIRRMPLDYGIILIARYLLGATQAEIANLMGCSQQRLSKKETQAINIIKKIIRTGC